MNLQTFQTQARFKIIKHVSKNELPSLPIIKELRKQYTKAKTKESKLYLFIKALREGNYKTILEQNNHIIFQDPNYFYTPYGIFLDISNKVIGWKISEVLNVNQQWIFPVWNKEYHKYDNQLHGGGVEPLLLNEIGLVPASAREMDFLVTFNKITKHQLARMLEQSFNSKE